MHYRLGNLTPRAELHALEMAALLSSIALPFLSSNPHFPTHLLSLLVFFLVALPIYAEQQRITVKPEVTT